MLYVVFDVTSVLNKSDIQCLMDLVVVHTYNSVVLIDDYLKYIVVVVDNVLKYMNSNNNKNDDQMEDEFLHKCLLYQVVKVMFHRTFDIVDYVSYEDLNLNYWSLSMMDIDCEQWL